ncbi:T9SS type A sorting domain-containing protein [Marinilabiliaceae bacterium N1Y90]|nr:T9SS type A sorting domain-containing protein [Marinilabiliaceae bacterium N1Y90]
MNGKLIQEVKGESINVGNVPSGVYLIQLIGQSGSAIQKVIIQ